jgi:hypothetical protein
VLDPPPAASGVCESEERGEVHMTYVLACPG